MELMGHLLIFFLAAGSAGLDRQLFPVAAIILLAAGVYFLGWGGNFKLWDWALFWIERVERSKQAQVINALGG